MMSRSNLSRGYSIAVLSAAILSTTAIFIRYLTQTYQIPPLVLALWRAGFVALTLVLVLVVVRPVLLHIQQRHWGYLIGYGLVLASFNAMWTLSVALNGAAVATVLAYSSAAFTALLGWWLLKESLGWVKVIAVTLSLVGCGLVSGAFQPEAWQVNTMGIITGMTAGLCYAVYSLLGRSAAQRGLNPWTTLLYTFISATLFLGVINLLPAGLIPGAATQISDFWTLGTDPIGWGLLFFLAAGPTVAGFGLYNVSLSYLPSSVANLILTTEPVFTAIIAYVLLGEWMDGWQISGGVLILAGVFFLRIHQGRRRRPAATIPGQPSVANID